MRLIGTLSNESYAKRISAYLAQKGIVSNCEMAFDAQSGQMSYHLWIVDEDKIQTATADFARFQEAPSNAEFDAPVKLSIESTESAESEEAPPAATITSWKKSPFTCMVLAICSFLFLLNTAQEIPLLQMGLQNVFLTTPLQIALLYDVPPSITAMEEVVASGNKENIQQRLEKIEKMPYWHGIYDLLILKFQGKDPSPAEGPLFSKILQGQVWRLLSPAFLHIQFFHILFNMIWVWILCRPIEERIGMGKMGLLTVITGVSSNTIQYLVSGPFFIGYSGIVMGLAGFIWMRERIAPWEGYPINRTTLLFLAIFIGAMLAFSIASFFLHLFASDRFAFDIANTAHIVGGVVGALLARLPFFSQRTTHK